MGEAQADRIRDEAARRGTRLHSMIEEQLGPNPPPEPDCPYWRCVRPLVKHIESVFGLELPVWNVEVGYAGTLDCLAMLDGHVTVLDWKGSTKPKREEWIEDYCLQAAAYVKAPKEPEASRAVIAVIVRGKPVQEFKLSSREIVRYWGLFRRRVDEFMVMQELLKRR